MSRRIIALLATSLLVQGCAEANSIYRVSKLSGIDPVVIASDAKQRFLLSQIEKVPDKDKPAFRRFCIEPSPDVFTVLSQSASGSGSLGLDSNSKSLNAAIQAAFSNSETGTTIPRTQTLNMLREMMYRTCERYLSGAIGEIELPIVAIRDQRVMVSILAIEQLTGAVTPKPVIISSAGSASTGQNSTETLKIVAKAREDLVTAEAGIKDAQTKMDEADTAAGDGKCAAVIAAAAPDTAKLKSCNDSKKVLDEATATRDEAEVYYKAQAKIANASQGVSSATSTPGPATDPKDWTLAQANAVKDVAATVQHIVDNTFQQDETQFFCFRQIGNPKAVLDTRKALGNGDDADKAIGTVQAQCLAYLMAKVRADTAHVDAKAARDLGMDAKLYTDLREQGRVNFQPFEQSASTIWRCLADVKKSNAVAAAMQTSKHLKDEVKGFQSALGDSDTALGGFLQDLAPKGRAEFKAIIVKHCPEG